MYFRKKILIGISLLTFLLVASLPLFSDFLEVLDEVDKLYDEGRHGEARNMLLDLLKEASNNQEEAEVYWRLARETLNLGDKAEENGASKEELLKIFTDGEAYADKAIYLDPNNHEGYFWKSANIGRWGQTKGIFDALFRAEEMRQLILKVIEIKPDHSDSFYVLGQLYEQVPGFPVSFGDKDYAVSFGRKSIVLYELEVLRGEDDMNYDCYNELAKHLWERNWGSNRRFNSQDWKKRKYDQIADVFEKNCFFEGTVVLKNMSDREEAFELVQYVIEELEDLPDKTKGQRKDLEEAKELLAQWTD
jgi:tetratricopeptide (TPR) repeat protein